MKIIKKGLGRRKQRNFFGGDRKIFGCERVRIGKDGKALDGDGGECRFLEQKHNDVVMVPGFGAKPKSSGIGTRT